MEPAPGLLLFIVGGKAMRSCFSLLAKYLVSSDRLGNGRKFACQGFYAAVPVRYTKRAGEFWKIINAAAVVTWPSYSLVLMLALPPSFYCHYQKPVTRNYQGGSKHHIMVLSRMKVVDSLNIQWRSQRRHDACH